MAIACDTRRFSREFSVDAALSLAANGITALLFDGVRPTPQLSFAVRELGCAAGIVITASHNPPQYNGYKVYGPDGGQAVSPLIDDVAAAISRVDLFDDVRSTSWEEAEKAGLVRLIGPEIDRSYREAIRSLSLSRPRTRLKVVYTPVSYTHLFRRPWPGWRRKFRRKGSSWSPTRTRKARSAASFQPWVSIRNP